MDERTKLNDAMKALAQGDRDAFDPVYAILWPMVRQFTASALPSAADGEDVAQEVLLKIFEQASDFDPDRGSAASWALSIAAFECRTARKRHARRREADPSALDDAPGDAPGPEDHLITRDLMEAAQETLGGLHPRDLEIVLGRLEGRRPAGVDGATLRKRVQRALDRLRVAWRRRYGVE